MLNRGKFKLACVSPALGRAGNEAQTQRSGKWLLGAEFGVEIRAPFEPSGSKQNSGGSEIHRNPNKGKAWQEAVCGATLLFTQLCLCEPFGRPSHLSPQIVFPWTRLNQRH